METAEDQIEYFTACASCGKLDHDFASNPCRPDLAPGWRDVVDVGICCGPCALMLQKDEED